MKKLRRLLAPAIALVMAAGLVMPAYAASYDVSTAGEVQNIIQNPVNNTGDDRDIILNMQNPIGPTGYIVTEKDWTYTFNGEDYYLYNVMIRGEGTVIINSEIKGYAGTGLIVTQDADVTVNGVIGGTTGMRAEENSTITVNGEVSGTTAAVVSDQAAIEVNGNVVGGNAIRVENSGTAVINGNIDSGNGVTIVPGQDGEASITVNGDIKARDNAIYLTPYADETFTVDIEVNGDIDAGNDGISLKHSGSSTVNTEINGNINAGNNGISSQSAGNSTQNTTVNGNINAGVDGINSTCSENGTQNITMNGNISASESEPSEETVQIFTTDKGHVTYQQTGDQTSDEFGIDLGASGESSISANIAGNINGENYLGVDNSGQIDLTVNGNNEGGYFFQADGGESDDPHISVEHIGNVHSEHGDALSFYNTSDHSDIDVYVKGTVSADDPERGIYAEGNSEKAAINIIIEGELDNILYRFNNEDDLTPVNAFLRTRTPGLSIPVSFMAETLDGEKLSSADGSMILVYFDPADEASCLELADAQKRYENGETVYGVCLTEDYEGAKAAAEKAGAEFGILKGNEELKAVLRASGLTEPQASLMLSDSCIIGMSRNVKTLAAVPGSVVDTPIEVVVLEEDHNGRN